MSRRWWPRPSVSAAASIYATDETFPSGAAALPEALAAQVAELAVELSRLAG